MKKSMIITILVGFSANLQAQNTFRDAYDQFKQQAEGKYETFREEANKTYVEFVRKAWEAYEAMPAVPMPKKEEVPPVIIPKEELLKPIESTPIQIEEEVVRIPKLEPQPVPVAPIREQPIETGESVNFLFYGTPMSVRQDNKQMVQLKACTPNGVADAWEKLSGKEYDNLIRDCLTLRIEHKLDDWAYVQMLERMAEACVGNKGNEATLLMAYVFCQSGYQMRLGMENGRLHILFATRHTMYGMEFYRMNGKDYYMYGEQVNHLDICDVAYPKETALSLWLPQNMALANRPSEPRTLKSSRFPDMELTVRVNRNLIDFMNNYPTSEVGGNFMTRWAMYANKPLEAQLAEELLPILHQKLMGLSEQEATERLLNWVQTAFVYEYDDKVWGGDRAFFPEETLYYPYCDCEDRSILFTRLVRNLLGLKCVLIYYPGHLASAVHFTNDDVAGDYILLDGQRFVVCDPTYIGAPVGRTMPDMDNETAHVILLE